VTTKIISYSSDLALRARLPVWEWISEIGCIESETSLKELMTSMLVQCKTRTCTRVRRKTCSALLQSCSQSSCAVRHWIEDSLVLVRLPLRPLKIQCNLRALQNPQGNDCIMTSRTVLLAMASLCTHLEIDLLNVVYPSMVSLLTWLLCTGSWAEQRSE